jgi:hypothetical protein
MADPAWDGWRDMDFIAGSPFGADLEFDDAPSIGGSGAGYTHPLRQEQSFAL